MDLNFWKDRWETGRIGFHEGTPNRHLRRFVDQLEGPHATGVLVPLCGKTVDLTFLSERFDRVVGVEFVEHAAREYFEERGLEPERTVQDGVPHYEGAGVTYIVSDFHAITLAQTGPIHGVFDRAAMIALPPEMRPRYAAHLLSLLPSRGRILLVTMRYPQGAIEGPPFSVTEEEIRAYYGATCTVERLWSGLPADVPAAFEGLDVAATVWLIAKR